MYVNRETQELVFRDPDQVLSLYIQNCAQPCFERADNDESDCLDELSTLTNLEKLFLQDRDMTALPRSISALTKLTLLQLECDKIKVDFSLMPRSIVYFSLEASLKEIPIGIFQMNLIDLQLTNNEIKKVPKEISRLITLKSLNLSCNLLTELPIELNKLTNLTHLWLEHNRLTNVPFLHRLVQLDTLDLGHNPIRRVSRLAPNLKYLVINWDGVSAPIEEQYSGRGNTLL